MDNLMSNPKNSCEWSQSDVQRVIAKCIYPMYNPDEKREELMVIDITYDPEDSRMKIDSRTVDMNGRLIFMGQPKMEAIENSCHFFDAMGIQNRRSLLQDIYFESANSG
jgi:hypothetical protein